MHEKDDDWIIPPAVLGVAENTSVAVSGQHDELSLGRLSCVGGASLWATDAAEMHNQVSAVHYPSSPSFSTNNSWTKK